MSAINRILLKLSGEVLQGVQGCGIDPEMCEKVASAISHLVLQGIQVGIVIGGGNIIRGKDFAGGGAQTPADTMGMLATMINGIALKQALEAQRCPSLVMSAIECKKAVPFYQWEEANHALDMGEVVIFVGGTGNPYFTTDTSAALRAAEIGAGAVLKATKVNGVYASDPIKNPNAERFSALSYKEALEKNLQVMDATAFALCQAERLPIYVFHMDLLFKNELLSVFSDESRRTVISN